MAVMSCSFYPQYYKTCTVKIMIIIPPSPTFPTIETQTYYYHAREKRANMQEKSPDPNN